MKKFALTATTMFFLVLVAGAQFNIGIKAGGNLSNQDIKIPAGGSLYHGSDNRTWHAGLVSEVELFRHVYLQPQLLWVRKGASHFSSLEDGRTKVRINYLEAPVNIVYKAPFEFGTFFAGAGMYYAYGISGRQEFDGHKTNLFKDAEGWNRQDYGLSFTAGFQFRNGLYLSMNSEKGLRNVYKADGISIRNKSRSVSIGYIIDWNKLRGKG